MLFSSVFPISLGIGRRSMAGEAPLILHYTSLMRRILRVIIARVNKMPVILYAAWLAREVNRVFTCKRIWLPIFFLLV